MNRQHNAGRGHPKLPLRLLLGLWLVLAVATTVVPVINWAQRPAGGTFTGYSYESVGDIFVYLNFIEQAQRGAMFFTNPFTPEPHEPMLLHPFFLVLGRISGVTGAPPLVVWHAARVALIAPLVLVLWLVLLQLPIGKTERLLAILAALFSSGIGMTIPESSVFLSILFSPKSILTILDTLLVILLLLRMQRDRKVLWWGVALVFLFVWQAFLEPYPLFLWASLAAAFLFISVILGDERRRALVTLGFVAAGTVAAVGLLAIMVLRSPILQAWSANAVGFPWSPLNFLFLLLPLAPLAIVGLVHGRSFARDRAFRLIVLWLAVGVAVSYSPYPYAYRVMGFVHIPLAILAVLGGIAVWRRSSGKRLAKAVVLFFLAFAVSDAPRHLARNISGDYYGANNRFLTTDETAMFRWVRGTTPPDALFLTSPSWDTLFAQQAYRRVYATSGWQTARFHARLRDALGVYSGTIAGAELQQLVASQGVSYVVVGWREKARGVWRGFLNGKVSLEIEVTYDFHPESAPTLERVFQNDSVEVYRVIPTT